jgi:acetyl esterase/lipase
MQDILTRVPPQADHRLSYGKDANQFGDLRLPAGRGPHPLVINIHGGFWRAAYDLEHNGHLCEALRRKGVATWSIEYRRIGQTGGGWPGTLHDVVAAAEHVYELARNYPLDLDRIIAMGHSAGGQLALYLGAELPWLQGVVSLAGVADLRHALDLKLSREAVKDFLGGTYQNLPERYQQASPMERLPLRRPTTRVPV